MSTPQDPTDEELEQLLRSGRTLEDAPHWLVERVIALGPAGALAPGSAAAAPPPLTVAAAATAAAAGAALRRVLARLVADTGGAPSLALGLRAAGVGTRQLLYAADDYAIDLHVSPAGAAGAGWILSGQSLGEPGLTEVRLSGEGRAQSLPLAEDGEFGFGPLPAGRWQLTLVGADVQIDLPPLDIAAEAQSG
jgi:hypothetical protein